MENKEVGFSRKKPERRVSPVFLDKTKFCNSAHSSSPFRQVVVYVFVCTRDTSGHIASPSRMQEFPTAGANNKCEKKCETV